MWPNIIKEIQHLSAPNHLILYATCLLCLTNQKYLPIVFKRLSWFLFFNLFIELGAHVMAHIYHQNLPLLHIYTLGELWLWSLFYREILEKKAFLNRYFYFFVGIVSVAVLLNSIFLQSIWTYNSYGKTLVQLVVIFYSLSFAFYFPEESEANNVSSKLLRAVNFAVMIYYCSTLFIFMAQSILMEFDKITLLILGDINVYLNAIFQLTMLIVLWKVIKNHRKYSYMSSSVS
jgi:hypothetical protein